MTETDVKPWEKTGMTEEAFRALSPEGQASLMQEVFKTEQAKEKWGSIYGIGIIAGSFFGLAAMIWAGSAFGAENEAPTPADKCMDYYFEDQAFSLKQAFKNMTDKGFEIELSLEYDMAQFRALIDSCETKTQTEAGFYKTFETAREFSTTVNDVTFEFK